MKYTPLVSLRYRWNTPGKFTRAELAKVFRRLGNLLHQPPKSERMRNNYHDNALPHPLSPPPALVTLCAYNSITIRPMGVVFISQSKNTNGLSGCNFCLCSSNDDVPLAILTIAVTPPLHSRRSFLLGLAQCSVEGCGWGGVDVHGSIDTLT